MPVRSPHALNRYSTSGPSASFSWHTELGFARNTMCGSTYRQLSRPLVEVLNILRANRSDESASTAIDARAINGRRSQSRPDNPGSVEVMSFLGVSRFNIILDDLRLRSGKNLFAEKNKANLRET